MLLRVGAARRHEAAARRALGADTAGTGGAGSTGRGTEDTEIASRLHLAPDTMHGHMLNLLR